MFFWLKTFFKLFFQLLAKAAVFLAGKCEETPRNLKDIVNVSHEIMNPHMYPLPFDSV